MAQVIRLSIPKLMPRRSWRPVPPCQRVKIMSRAPAVARMTAMLRVKLMRSPMKRAAMSMVATGVRLAMIEK